MIALMYVLAGMLVLGYITLIASESVESARARRAGRDRIIRQLTEENRRLRAQNSLLRLAADERNGAGA